MYTNPAVQWATGPPQNHKKRPKSAQNGLYFPKTASFWWPTEKLWPPWQLPAGPAKTAQTGQNWENWGWRVLSEDLPGGRSGRRAMPPAIQKICVLTIAEEPAGGLKKARGLGDPGADYNHPHRHPLGGFLSL